MEIAMVREPVRSRIFAVAREVRERVESKEHPSQIFPVAKELMKLQRNHGGKDPLMDNVFAKAGPAVGSVCDRLLSTDWDRRSGRR